MGRLIVLLIASVDGYVADSDGDVSWAAPDEEVHQFVNDLARPVGTYIYGRQMYDVMQYWATIDASMDPSPVARDFARIWQSARKIVVSTTLTEARSPYTSLRTSLSPDDIATLKAAAPDDLAIAGPSLASVAWDAGLVDELQLFLVPHLVGEGTRAFPTTRHPLTLVEEKAFGSGTVFLRYQSETG